MRKVYQKSTDHIGSEGDYRELFPDFCIFVFYRQLPGVVYGVVFQAIHLQEQS